VAADIHGKNHHLDGSFIDHVHELALQLPDGSTVQVSPTVDPDLFWATAGGMGLTGMVLWATFQLKPITSSRLLVDTDRIPDLDALLALMVEGDDEYHYSVAWVDLMAGGASTGRGVLDRGRFADAGELPGDDVDPLSFAPRVVAPAPPWAPPRLLNPVSVRAFNELWYRKAPQHAEGAIQTITQFFHPLDLIDGWNRVYGTHGFLQWQCVVPDGAEETLRRLVDALSRRRCTSFVNVLKRFGPANDGPLSFPLRGWTLAVDIPAGRPDIGPFLDELDREVAGAGGRLYLAKDSRMRPELLGAMYPRLEDWRAVRQRVDPDRRIQSDLGARLGL
jgi:decaprenylphospho-beta-D-ribofuranose 2-oxidase